MTIKTSEKTRLRAERSDEMRLENKNIGTREVGHWDKGARQETHRRRPGFGQKKTDEMKLENKNIGTRDVGHWDKGA